MTNIYIEGKNGKFKIEIDHLENVRVYRSELVNVSKPIGKPIKKKGFFQKVDTLSEDLDKAEKNNNFHNDYW